MIFTLLVIVLKPLLIFIINSVFKYTKRTSFLTAIHLAQISEFALVLAFLGLSAGHVSEQIFTLAILLAMITITVSSYFAKFQDGLYRKLAKLLKWFDVSNTSAELRYIEHEENYDVVLCGYDRIGFNILKRLEKMKKKFLVVDFNPDIVRMLIKKKIHCLYGDVSDPEILELLNFTKTKLVISTIPDYQVTRYVMRKAKRQNKNIRILVTAYSVEEALKLYDRGADYVVLPHFIGGHHVSNLVGEFTSSYEKVLKHKKAHLRELKERASLGHKHPKRDLHFR